MLFNRRRYWLHMLIAIVLFYIANLLGYSDLTICGSSSFPWFYKSGMIAVLYMAIGGLYWKYEDHITYIFQQHKWLYIAALVIFVVIIVYSEAQFSTITANVNCLGLFGTCLISFLIISVFKKCNNSNLISFIGRNSIGFYFLSGSIPNILALIGNRIENDSIVLLLLLIPMAFSLAYLCVRLIVKYFPFMFDLRSLKK